MREKIIVSLYFLVVILDIYSTIIQSPNMEENPFMRRCWLMWGDIGLVLTNLILGFLTICFYLYLRELRTKTSDIVMSILTVFRFLIVLTNLALIPYWITAWFSY